MRVDAETYADPLSGGVMADRESERWLRFVPLVRRVWIRTALGFVLLAASVAIAAALVDASRLGIVSAGSVIAWAIAVFVTQKYVHKYPQRYFTYFVASHLKAAITMALFVWIVSAISGPIGIPRNALWIGFAVFVCADALVSALRRREVVDARRQLGGPSLGEECSPVSDVASCPIDRQATLERIRTGAPKSIVDFFEQILPDTDSGSSCALVLEAQTAAGSRLSVEPTGLVVAKTRLNDVYKLDDYLLLCARSVAMGGYVVARYAPLEDVASTLRDRYGRVLYLPAVALHFLWFLALPKTPLINGLQYIITRKGNRSLSKAEAWGRLSYCGLHVIAELDEGVERYLVAQRVEPPARGKRPSYYPIISLEKVGLGGEVMYLHKLRSMYPYSEFLQKRVYEEQGLTATGKFANDFRITRFGRFVRRYWLDELPQVLDWLRGDIKLVGMRATSPHYLSLYPAGVVDLYVQVKPGLVPPVFDEDTNGFDQIVEVEREYLKRYLAAPIRTDVAYFLRTCWDIFRGGVRGK